jgi:3-oxoacyl-[acyl-carrier protein] reductase
MPEQELAGKNAIITGASRGLGLAIAGAFARSGANLLLVARSLESLERARRQLTDAGARQVNILAKDLHSSTAPEEIVIEARRLWQRVDVLVNNAAVVGPIGNLWENDWPAWEAAMRVNLMAPVALCRSIVPWMAQAGGGAIINISGGGATKPRARFTAYGTAKAALVRFSETLAEEAGPMGIRVNCIAPGAMNTAMLDAVLQSGAGAAGPEYAQALKQAAEGGTSPGIPADLCVFLASPRSAGITGRLISAVWDQWQNLSAEELRGSDIFTLRRIVPEDRGGR